MKLLVFLEIKKRKGIVLEYPDINILLNKIEKIFKIKISGNKFEKIEYIRRNLKDLIITIENFDYSTKTFLKYLDLLKPSIKELIINLESLNISKEKIRFLIRNKAIIITKDGNYFINKEINLEPITIAILLLIILYISSYIFATAFIIYLFYLAIRRYITN